MFRENYRPRARRKGLLQTEVGEELVVLDTERNRGMALSPELARLFRLCDGKRTVARISDAMTLEVGWAADSAAVWSGLRRLQKARLLEGDLPFPKSADIRSRRQALKAIGLGAGALAVVMLPTPADAASCFPNASPCVTDADCCSGRCCNSNQHCGTRGPGC